jgi:hypothetical protein
MTKTVDNNEQVRRIKAWADRRKLTPEQRQDLAYFYDTIRTPKLWNDDSGFIDLDRIWDTYRAANPSTRKDLEHEVHERVTARQREEAAQREAQAQERAEAMVRETPRESVQRALEEAKGSEFQPAAPVQNEPVGATIRRSMAELKEQIA